MKITILGVGNRLLGDEGVGLHILEALEEKDWPAEVELLDGGTRGLALLPFLEETTHLLVVDAVKADAPPGTVVEFHGEEVYTQPPVKFSAHDIALPDLLSLLRATRPTPLQGLALVGVVPGSIRVGITLSEPVWQAIPEAVGRIHRIIARWLKSLQSDRLHREQEWV